jgi:hypothetical protein
MQFTLPTCHVSRATFFGRRHELISNKLRIKRVAPRVGLQSNARGEPMELGAQSLNINLYDNKERSLKSLLSRSDVYKIVLLCLF